MYQRISNDYGPVADWLYLNGFKVIGLPAGLLFFCTYLLLYFLLPSIMKRGVALWAVVAWPVCVLIFIPPYWRALGMAMTLHDTGTPALDTVMWRWLDMIGLVVAAIVCLLFAVSVPLFKRDGDGVLSGQMPHQSQKTERKSESQIGREVRNAFAEQERVAQTVVAMRNQSHSG